MKEFILSSEFRQILELIYFLCAPFLVLLALIGLKQLRIAKETLRINSQRDASRLSINLISKFDKISTRNYSNLCTALKKDELEQPLEFFKFTKEEYESIPKEKKEEFNKRLKIANIEFSDIAEDLEAFAVPFIHKIADENIAFNSIGGKYCILMGICYPFIMESRIELKTNLSYSDAVDLYNIWFPKLKNRLTEEKIKDLELEIKKGPDQKIKPLGT